MKSAPSARRIAIAPVVWLASDESSAATNLRVPPRTRRRGNVSRRQASRIQTGLCPHTPAASDIERSRFNPTFRRFLLPRQAVDLSMGCRASAVRQGKTKPATGRVNAVLPETRGVVQRPRERGGPDPRRVRPDHRARFGRADHGARVDDWRPRKHLQLHYEHPQRGDFLTKLKW